MTMKKINIALAALLAAAAAVSCQKEIGETGDVQKEKETVAVDGLTFSAVADELTRTSIDGTGKVTWTAYDAISIFDGTGAAGKVTGYTNDKKYVMNTLEGGTTAVFKPSTEDDRAAEGKTKYYAMCPRDYDACCDVENGIFDFWLLDCQKGNKGGFSDYRSTAGKHLNYSVAMTTEPATEPLVFKNAVTQLKITVPEFLAGKVTHIAIIPLGGEYIAGDTEVVLGDDGNITTVTGRYDYHKDNADVTDKGSKYSVVYLFPDYSEGIGADKRYSISGATFEAGDYYAAIRNTTLSKGLLIEYRATASGGNAQNATSLDAIATKSTGSAVTLLRSHLYKLGSFGDKPSTAPASVGITGLPYCFSFYCSEQKDEAGKYITKGSLSDTKYTMSDGAYSGYVYTQYSGVAATEKDESIGASLSLSAVSYYKTSSAEKTSTSSLSFWAQPQAHDNINTKCFCTRYGNEISGLPFECGEFLTIPLQTDIPSAFTVSFGLYYAGVWGMKDWNVYYSNDNVSWIQIGETVSLTNVGDAGKNYMYFQVKEDDSPIALKAGGMLYLKIVPVGRASQKSESCDGFGAGTSTNGQIRFHSSITVSPAEAGASSAESGAAIFEGFDGFSGGLDYFIGDRLAGMANFCGAKGSLSGYTLSNVYQRPGYAQIGFVDSQTMKSDSDMTTTNLLGSLTTPAAGKAGDLTLSFKACVYRTPAYRTNAPNKPNADCTATDITTIRINVTGGGTIDGATTVDIEDVSTSEWQTITKTVTGATADTKIEFTSPTDGLFHRWFIDDICLK